MLLAGSIFLLTLILVSWQPRGLCIGWSASIGAVLALVTGVIHIADIPVVWNIVSADFFGLGFTQYASVMIPVDVAAIAATLVMLHLFFRRDIPATYDVSLLKTPASAIAAAGAVILFAVAKRGHAINTGKVLRGASWQIVIFSLGMYLVVYGLLNAGLTEYLSGVLNVLADKGLWAATLGTGFLTAFLSSVMNIMPTVLVGALSIDGSTATGVIKEAMIYANVIGCDLGPKITPIGSLATLLWLHVLAQKNMTITWGYYFRAGIVMTLPVLFVTLAALALRLSVTL
ncbi:TPA: ArsB/NhaD family transporter [Enterobacter hormaechei subsp. xiangfangensis]|nr:hypothetical protein [Enterobacter asburiae]